MHQGRDAGRRWLRMPGGAFARGVVTLASGTAAAQLLTVVALPLITRLYSPADYGTLAVYSSTLTLLLVVGSLRYELAIPLPESEDVARALLALAFLLLAGMTGLIALLVGAAGRSYVSALKVPALASYLWLLPLGFAGGGTYQALSYWALRRRAFGPIARTRLSQGVGQVATQAGLGAAGIGAPGLLIGDVVGRVAGAGTLTLLALREPRSRRRSRASLSSVARRYRRFPLLTTWAGLLNIGSLQLPSLVFASAFGAAAAGLYALSYKVLLLPTMLVAQAVGQVFLASAAPLAKEPERLREVTERTALVLLGLGLPLFGAVGLGGPRLFATALGGQWEPAGRYAQLLTPWFALWLVSNPLSGLFNIREWQGWSLAFSAVEFALRLGALVVGARRGSPILAVGLLSACGALIALTSLSRFLHAGHSSLARLAGPAARLLALALVCLLPGAVALHAGHESGALVLTALAIGAYYFVVLRSAAASRILYSTAGAGATGVSP